MYPFCYFMLLVYHAVMAVHCSLVVTCWDRAGLLALLYDVFYCFVTFPCDVLGEVRYLVVSIPDLWRLPYSVHKRFKHKWVSFGGKHSV